MGVLDVSVLLGVEVVGGHVDGVLPGHQVLVALARHHLAARV